MRYYLDQNLEQFLIGVYGGEELVQWEILIGVFLDDKFDCFFLGFWLESVDGLNIGPNEGIEIFKSPGALYIILINEYDVIELI